MTTCCVLRSREASLTGYAHDLGVPRKLGYGKGCYHPYLRKTAKNRHTGRQSVKVLFYTNPRKRRWVIANMMVTITMYTFLWINLVLLLWSDIHIWLHFTRRWMNSGHSRFCLFQDPEQWTSSHTVLGSPGQKKIHNPKNNICSWRH